MITSILLVLVLSKTSIRTLSYASFYRAQQSVTKCQHHLKITLILSFFIKNLKI